LQQGETGANVLVGIQVPSSEIDEFHDRANGLGYDYNVVVKTVATQRLIY
jgi:threonine dehydratase